MILTPENSLNAILLAIIGFWLIRYITRSDKKLDVFIKLVTDLSKQLAVVIANYDNKDKTCTSLHKIIDHKLEKIEERELKSKPDILK